MEIWSMQVLVKLCFIVFVIFKLGLTDKSTWHRGCVIFNISQVNSSDKLEAAPTECLRFCSHRGFPFVGLQGIKCVCFQEYAGFLNVSDEQCFERYDGLPCGGGLAVSIYSTYGPYVNQIQLRSASINQLNSDTLFEARIFLASDVSEPTGLEELNSTTLTSVSYRWDLNGSVVTSGERVVTNNSAVVAFVHEFNQEGHYVIDLWVRNSVSQLTASTSITIVQPYPAILHVALSPGQIDIPSCIPLNSGLTSNSPAVAVFMDQPTVFQASVVRGLNISFIWQFGEDVVLSASLKSCSGIECLEDQQVYTFREKGTFEVSVNATNYLGSIVKTLNVVVSDKSISNLTVELAERSTVHNEVDSAVHFVVKLDTAGRAVSTLMVDFGDGSSYNHSLQDVNDTFINGGSDDPAHLHLSASYGEGCRLLISLDHVYQEVGVYQVMVAVSNNDTTEGAVMEEQLEILPRISHLNISRAAVYQTGEEFNVSVINWEHSGVTLHWCISNNNAVIFQQVTNDSRATFVVEEAGWYTLNVSATNAISSASSEMDITIQDPVEVAETFTVTRSVTRPGRLVKFSLLLLQGSNLSALWNFGDNTTELIHVSNETSLKVAHEYANVGQYDPFVDVWNLVSEVRVSASECVTVLEEIEDVTILSEEPTKFPGATVVEVSVRKGVNISFTISYGQVTIHPETQLLVLGTYLLTFYIPHVGAQQVNLNASNVISSVTREFFVLVLKDIHTLSVDVIPSETNSVLLVKENGVVPERSDLLYSWLEEGTGFMMKSASPTLLVGNSQIAGRTFNLTVSNQVSSKSIVITLGEYAESRLSLSHPLNVEVGQDVQFELKVDETVNISVNFGDGGEILSPNITSFTCTHKYTMPSVYAVSILVNYANGSKANTTSVITVLEQIVDLQIIGPNVSVYSGPDSKLGWELIPSGGSNIVYEWIVFPVGNPFDIISRTIAGGHTKTYLAFPSPGIYNLTVNASNSISSVQSSVMTLLQEPITSLVVSCDPTLITTNAEICVQVVGSTPLEILMDFDDNVTENWSSEDETIQTMKPQLDVMNSNHHMYTIVKNFTSVGEHQVSVTVDNKVSSQFRHHVVIVGHAVSGLVITSDNSWLVNIQEQVVMYATVITGSDVIFEWNFSDPIGSTGEEESNGTFSKVTHFFGAPGEYQVSVSARNNIQTTPIMATYNITFSVLEAIFALELRVTDYSKNAPLVQHGDVWKTSVIHFRAECWGSHVMFQFDFKDGTTTDISGTTGSYGSYFAVASHRFTQEGEFLVSVTARNLLSNVTATLGEPFLVQIAPTAVRFNKNLYVYRFGEMANLEVQLDLGSQVLFNWSMGDQTDYLNAPSAVDHMYHSEGVFTVTVVAFNSIHHSRTSCSVFIQNPIQGVEVLTESHLVATRSKIDLKARTFSGNPLWFYWDFGDNQKVQHTSVSVFSYSYLEAGMYTITVVAGNHISNATSPPLTLTLVEPLSRVDIHDDVNVFLAGTETVLLAIPYSGSDVRYIWNFGDGSPEVDTHLQSVSHHYNGTGVYYVTLSGYNQISNKTVTTRIFIVNEMCEPPSLKVFGSENQLFRQSEDIRMEADVKIDCEVTDLADYTWTLNESQSAFSFPPRNRVDYFGRRTMFIPRRVLDVGSYIVSLKVQMNGTIVFNTVTSSIRVVHSDLVSVIEGGTQRFFRRDDVVVMNGDLSFDPDDPTSDLSYRWKCLQLESTRPCFGHPGLSNMSSVLPSGNQSLTFPVAWLLTNQSDNFVFTLEVGKSGRVPVESFQIITIYQEKPVLELSVDCPHCEGGMVNSNDLLTLEALCPDCDNGTVYEWSLYIVRDGKTGPSPSDARCVQDNPSDTNVGEAQSVTSSLIPVTQTVKSGSVSGEEMLARLTTQRPSTDVNTRHVSSTIHGMVTPAKVPPISSVEVTTNRRSVSPTLGFQEFGSSFDYEVIESVYQDHAVVTQVSRISRAPTRRATTEVVPLASDGNSVYDGLSSSSSDYFSEVQAASNDQGSIYWDHVGDWYDQDDTATTTLNPTPPRSTTPSPEGVEPSLYEGGSIFSDVGYEEYDIEESVNEFPETEVGASDYSADEDVESDNDESLNPVRDDNTPPEIEEHLISKERIKVPLTVDQTLTGLSGNSLTIKDGVLTEGRTYAVGLKVTKQDGGKRQEGEVFQYLEVNEAPKLGTCSISPVVGQQLDTFFIANCREWQDTDLPLRFKISYSLNETGPYTVLYFGMNHAAKFLLPSGYEANDYKVYLKLAIVDSKGGRRSVCDIPLRVEPNYRLIGDDPPESIESYLYYLTVAPNNELSILLDQGDSSSAHAFVRIVTHILNHMDSDSSEAVIQCNHYYHRCKIRHVLVSTIQMLPLRDSLEILQTSQALSSALAATNEISVETLAAARSHLLNIVELCFRVSKWELELDVFYAVISSIAAVYDSQERHYMAERHRNRRMISKDPFYQTLDAESRIINLFTGMKLPNTSPLKHTSSLMDVTADQVTQLSSLKLTTKDVDMTFPFGIETVLWNISGTLEKPMIEEDCFNVGLVAYHMNPFHWGRDAGRITTNIASAHVYSCEGERYNITSLPEGRGVMFDIMNFCSEDRVSCNFTFDPNYMNDHQFNMTDDNVGQDLHIVLTMRPTKNRAYPLHVLLRYNERPYPDEFDERWVYSEGDSMLDIFLPAGSLNDTGSYHLAVVDGELGEIVYREDGDQLRSYSLTMWWGQCLSWSFSQEEWNDKGCKMIPAPNHFVTQCQCDHVGIHGVSFLPVTSQLGQVHVSLLLVNPHNPIVYTIYTVVLGVYLLLFVYCYLNDRHDYDKPGLIFLKDNQVTDKQ